MAVVREPTLKPVKIEDLRPTQITVGMREVEAKRRTWREKGPKEELKFLEGHMMPVILGPKQRHYIIDHHHLARALHEEGRKDVLVTVVADLSKLDKDAFWVFLDNRSWLHPFDEDGRRRAYTDIPKSIRELTDDPYRSLAGELRRLGGFAKDTTPFSEFLWADFLRRRVKGSWWTRISTTLCRSPCSSPKAPMPITCPAGADRCPPDSCVHSDAPGGTCYRTAPSRP